MASFTLTGRTVGKYQIHEPLGRGGMSQVYRAYHPQLDRFVALKVIRADLADDPSFLARFQREARAVAGLRHPNIVQVHDFDVADDLSYMVMELLEGDSLKSRLTQYHLRGEQMPLGDAIRVTLDILDGLAFAHDNGMVHRDIKPANILLTNDGQAVLADFGVAQIVGATRQTASGALMGTLRYMAPEQGLEGIYDARTDIYALGIVLYEMLFQSPPFDADTPLAVLMKHLNDPLPLPDEHEVPAELEALLLRTLSKDPAERYQSAGKMARALHQVSASVGIELPEQISRPLSFQTDESSGDGVAVLSGKARQALQKTAFAEEETALTNLDNLAFEEELPVLSEEEQEILLARSVFNSFGLWLGLNVFAVAVMFLIDRGSFWQFAWPFELLGLAGFLFMIMRATRSIWVLIPAALFTGQGLLFTYFTFTGRWSDYAFLWIVQLAVVLFPVILTLNLLASHFPEELLARRLGAVGFLAAFGSGALIIVATILFF